MLYGYNNGVTLLNEGCKSCYSSSTWADARSINMLDVQDILNAQNLTLEDSSLSVTNLETPFRWSQTASISRSTQGMSESYSLTTETTSSWTNISYKTYNMRWEPTMNPTIWTYKHSGDVYAELLGWINRRE